LIFISFHAAIAPAADFLASRQRHAAITPPLPATDFAADYIISHCFLSITHFFHFASPMLITPLIISYARCHCVLLPLFS